MTTETRVAPTSTTLDRLLDDELSFSPTFAGYYSSHLAMALVALHQLGAPPSVLEAAFAAHASGEAEPRDDWALLDERRREVARDGIEATVRARVPALVEGPGSQLFHPMIRLAYALDVGHPGQVAAALADWEDRHQVLPLPVPRAPSSAGSPSPPTPSPTTSSPCTWSPAPGRCASWPDTSTRTRLGDWPRTRCR